MSLPHLPSFLGGQGFPGGTFGFLPFQFKLKVGRLEKVGQHPRVPKANGVNNSSLLFVNGVSVELDIWHQFVFSNVKIFHFKHVELMPEGKGIACSINGGDDEIRVSDWFSLAATLRTVFCAEPKVCKI